MLCFEIHMFILCGCSCRPMDYLTQSATCKRYWYRPESPKSLIPVSYSCGYAQNIWSTWNGGSHTKDANHPLFHGIGCSYGRSKA